MAKLNVDELEEALTHFRYEAAMMIEAPELHRAHTSQVIKNAAIESFATHFRNLAYFFELNEKLPQADDITLSDFAPHLENWTKPHLPDEDLQFVRDQIAKSNKQVAHLTKSRLKKNNPDWPWNFVKIINIIAPFWLAFEVSVKEKFTPLSKIVENAQSPQHGSTGMTVASWGLTAPITPTILWPR